MTPLALIFTTLLLLGMPVAFAIGIAGFSYFLLSDFLPLSIAVQKVASASQSFPLLAIPFFVLAGHVMNHTGITERLLRFSNILVSWMSGGLAQVSIVLSALMGGISGSAVADACMEARILGPSMVEKGYSKGYSASIIALSSLVTATIPPSVGLILYGFLANVSIGRLFLAGIIPGILMALFLMVAAYFVAKRRGYGAETSAPPKFRDIWIELNHAKWALLFPVILVVGIRSGIFTPSEAGAFAVVYALLVGVVAHKELTMAKLRQAFDEAISDVGMIMLIIMFSAMVGYAIIFEQAPQSIAAAINSISTNPHILLALILVFLLLIGMVVESTVNVLLLTPIFVPIIRDAGIDPVHFGILMMTIVTLGAMTPPVGVAMYAVCGIMDCPTDEYVRESIPFVSVILLLVVILMFFPGIVLLIPNLLM